MCVSHTNGSVGNLLFFVKVKASREPRLRTNGLAQIHTLNVNIPVHDLFSTNTNIHKNLLSEHI